MVSFKKFRDSDFETMYRWLQKPHVKEWWNDGDDTIEKVTDHYSKEDDLVSRYILQSESLEPIGYFQFYIESAGVVGIDQFIGEESFLNKGVGTEAVKMFVEMISCDLDPRMIIVDPEPNNRRAIRCYEKVGFQFAELRVGEKGKEAYIMRMERDV